MEMSNLPTIHEMNDNTYHADPCPEPSLSSGVARTLYERSPLHAYHQHPRLGGSYSQPSKIQIFGQAVHKMVLQPEDSQPLTLVVGPDGAYKDWRTKDAREQRDLATMEGNIPLLEHEYLAAKELADVINESRLFRRWNVGEQTEHAEKVITWTEDGFWFRIKPDYYVETEDDIFVTDLKTTGVAATPDGWARTQMWDYAMQSALYRRGLQTLYPGREIEWKFMVAETDPPYGISAFEFDEQGTDYADKICEAAVSKWKSCMEHNKWPCYPDNGVYQIETPFYIRDKMVGV